MTAIIPTATPLAEAIVELTANNSAQPFAAMTLLTKIVKASPAFISPDAIKVTAYQNPTQYEEIAINNSKPYNMILDKLK